MAARRLSCRQTDRRACVTGRSSWCWQAFVFATPGRWRNGRDDSPGHQAKIILMGVFKMAKLIDRSILYLHLYLRLSRYAHPSTLCPSTPMLVPEHVYCLTLLLDPP